MNLDKPPFIVDSIITVVGLILGYDEKNSSFSEAKKNISFLNQKPDMFINQLLEFDKESINKQIMKNLEPKIKMNCVVDDKNDSFNIESI